VTTPFVDLVGVPVVDQVDYTRTVWGADNRGIIQLKLPRHGNTGEITYADGRSTSTIAIANRHDLADDVAPVISPDGKHIAWAYASWSRSNANWYFRYLHFYPRDRTTYSIVVTDIKGQHPQVIVSYNFEVSEMQPDGYQDVRWGADGKSISYVFKDHLWKVAVE